MVCLFEYRRGRDLKHLSGKIQEIPCPDTFFISWLTLPVQTYSGKEKTSCQNHPDEQLCGLAKRSIYGNWPPFWGLRSNRCLAKARNTPKNGLDESGLVAFLKRKKHSPIPSILVLKFISTREVVREKATQSWGFWKYTSEWVRWSSTCLPKRSKRQHRILCPETFLSCPGPAKKIPYNLRNKIQMLWPLGLFGLVMLSSLVSLVLCIFMDVLVLKILACIFPLIPPAAAFAVFGFCASTKICLMNPARNYRMKRWGK